MMWWLVGNLFFTAVAIRAIWEGFVLNRRHAFARSMPCPYPDHQYSWGSRHYFTEVTFVPRPPWCTSKCLCGLTLLDVPPMSRSAYRDQKRMKRI